MNNDTIQAYGALCGLFYDATEKYASDKEVDFFASYIQSNPGRVLEAMSGSGRLQIPLMQCGYIVDGVDHSYAMLERCRQRCVGLGLAPELYQESIENFLVPHRYSTIIIAVASFQLIVDRAVAVQALKNLHAHMTVDGNLFIDTFVPDITLDENSVSIARLDDHRVIRLTKRHTFDEDKKIARTFCLYELIVAGIIQQQANELIEVVWRSDKEWRELLSEAGFEIIKIHDERFKESELSRIIHAKPIVKT